MNITIYRLQLFCVLLSAESGPDVASLFQYAEKKKKVKLDVEINMETISL